jgi:uncharacterized membrane protein
MKRFLARSIFVILILALSFILKTRLAYCQSAESNVEISPSIIDQSAKARDILETQIKITNHASTSASLYTLVSYFDEQNNLLYQGEVDNLSKATSMVPWINIKRGVIDLAPGQSTETTLRIEVNLNALPGKYHAAIVFAQGSSHPDALSRARVSNQPQVLVNLNVEANIIEKAQLINYNSNKNIFLNLPSKPQTNHSYKT